MVNKLDDASYIRPPSNSVVDQLGVDERYTLKEILGHKLRNIPAGMLFPPPPRKADAVFSRHRLEITEVLNHAPKAINLPQ